MEAGAQEMTVAALTTEVNRFAPALYFGNARAMSRFRVVFRARVCELASGGGFGARLRRNENDPGALARSNNTNR
jgi:hypothetical protein